MNLNIFHIFHINIHHATFKNVILYIINNIFFTFFDIYYIYTDNIHENESSIYSINFGA